MRAVKTKLPAGGPEIKAATLADDVEDETFSGSVRTTIRRIAAISCYSRNNPGGFLFTSDCMAERGGFEPPIQVLARITV
jgi:hypothetical protein